MATNFVNSYNDLSTRLCDNLFRTIQNVTVSVESTRRVLQWDLHGRELQNFVSVGKVKVKGSCRGLGCSLTISGSGSDASTKPEGLFSKAVIRDQQMVMDEKIPRDLTNLGCFCGADTMLFRTATVQEFISTYDFSIRNSVSQDLLTGINGVTKVTEVLSVDGCDNPVEEFDTVVLVELSADDSEKVASEELDILGDAFARDYNDLTSILCENIFRNIQNISVAVENVRRRLDEGDNAIRKLSSFVITGKATVKGTCKGYGCSSQVTGLSTSSSSSGSTTSSKAAGLFSARASRRHMLEISDRQTLRNLVSGCFCDETTADFRSPTNTEFVVSYNDSVSTLASEGVLRSVVGALGVQQVMVPVVNGCDATEEVYDTALLLNVSAAVQPGQTVSDETFGDSLIASYNDLSTSLCDPWNRKLRWLMSKPDTANRRLVDGFVSVQISGTCRGKGCALTVLKNGLLSRQLFGGGFGFGNFKSVDGVKTLSIPAEEGEENAFDQGMEVKNWTGPMSSMDGAKVSSISQNDGALAPGNRTVLDGCFCGTVNAAQRAPTEGELITNMFSKLSPKKEFVSAIISSIRISSSPDDHQ